MVAAPRNDEDELKEQVDALHLAVAEMEEEEEEEELPILADVSGCVALPVHYEGPANCYHFIQQSGASFTRRAPGVWKLRCDSVLYPSFWAEATITTTHNMITMHSNGGRLSDRGTDTFATLTADGKVQFKERGVILVHWRECYADVVIPDELWARMQNE